MSTGEVTAARTERMLLYGFLATALYEPAPPLVAALREPESYAELCRAVQACMGAGQEALVGQMRDAAAGELKDLTVEYNRLFVGPSAPPCPPYESVYDPFRAPNQEGTVMGPAADAMAEHLRSAGLVITLDHAELPDHAAIELEFMYFLLERIPADALDADPQAEHANRFLSERLAWLPEFGALVAEEARHPFYRALGSLLSGFLAEECQRIG